MDVKYTEASGGFVAASSRRHDELSRAAAIFHDPDAPTLRGGALGPFWRQSLLATAMLERGLYDEGRVVILAPFANTPLWRTVGRYAAELISPDPAEVRFSSLALESFVATFGEAGAKPIAERIIERYLDVRPANVALQAALTA
jgi:hypothetical protein